MSLTIYFLVSRGHGNGLLSVGGYGRYTGAYTE